MYMNCSREMFISTENKVIDDSETFDELVKEECHWIFKMLRFSND